MKIHLRFNLFFLMLTGFLLSCNKTDKPKTDTPKNATVEGSIFIVTQGGTNYKLGLVKVLAIPTESLTSVTSEFESQITKEISSPLSELEKQWVDLSQILHPSALKASEEATALLKEEIRVSNSFKDYEKIIDVDTNENEFTVGSGVAVDSPYIQTALFKTNEIQIKRKNLYDKEHESIRSYVENKSKLFNVVHELAESLKSSSLNRGLVEYSQKSDRIEWKATSDADGKFKLNLDPLKSYYLLAVAQRKVGDSTEEYAWSVNLSSDAIVSGSEVFLSNDGLAESYMGSDEGGKVSELSTRVERLNLGFRGLEYVGGTLFEERPRPYRAVK